MNMYERIAGRHSIPVQRSYLGHILFGTTISTHDFLLTSSTNRNTIEKNW